MIQIETIQNCQTVPLFLFSFLTQDGILSNVNIMFSKVNKTIKNNKTIEITKMEIGLTKELFFSLS